MANLHRGQIPLKTGEQEFTLSFSINAMCELEDLLDCSINEVAAKVQDPKQMRVGFVRAIIWAALQDNHPDIDLQQAGKIATDAGMPAVMEAVTKCLIAAFPKPEAKKTANPKRAATA